MPKKPINDGGVLLQGTLDMMILKAVLLAPAGIPSPTRLKALQKTFFRWSTARYIRPCTGWKTKA